MKRVAAVLLLVSVFCVHAAESGVTNLVVTASEVDPKSIKLTAAESPQPNLTFNYVGKTPARVKAIYRSHAAVLVVKDGVVFARAAGCTGHKDRIGPDGHVDSTGLVLIFDDLDQARIAERVLKREDPKKEWVVRSACASDYPHAICAPVLGRVKRSSATGLTLLDTAR